MNLSCKIFGHKFIIIYQDDINICTYCIKCAKTDSLHKEVIDEVSKARPKKS